MAKEINTSIIIDAPIDQVWDVLMDTASYPEWNPFIKSIEGELVVGSTIKAHIDGMTFTPKVLSLKPRQEFVWKGKLWLSGVFEGIHRFILEDIRSHRTRFVHAESFSGVLAIVLWHKLNTETRQGFISMNKALKKRCESQ